MQFSAPMSSTYLCSSPPPSEPQSPGHPCTRSPSTHLPSTDQTLSNTTPGVFPHNRESSWVPGRAGGVWQPEPASCFQHQVTGDDSCNSFCQDTCACTSTGSGPHMCPPTGTLWIYPNIRPGSFTRPGRRPAAAGCRFPKHPAHLSH